MSWRLSSNSQAGKTSSRGLSTTEKTTMPSLEWHLQIIKRLAHFWVRLLQCVIFWACTGVHQREPPSPILRLGVKEEIKK